MLRHSRLSCYLQKLPERGDTATFPVCKRIFCASEAPYQQEAHANRDALWSNSYLAQKILHIKMQTTVKLQMYRHQSFLAPMYPATRAQNSVCHWKPKSNYSFLIDQRKAQFLLLLHQFYIGVAPPKLSESHWQKGAQNEAFCLWKVEV